MATTEDEEIIDLSFEPEPLFERYSTRHEFPISLIASALILLACFGVLLLAFYAINHTATDTKPVPIMMVQPGDDETGEGSPGSEGNPDSGAISLLPPSRDDI